MGERLVNGQSAPAQDHSPVRFRRRQAKTKSKSRLRAMRIMRVSHIVLFPGVYQPTPAYELLD